jgi:CHAT domain-containing protein
LNRRISEINDAIRKQEATNSQSLNSLYSQLDSARLEYQSFQDSLYVAHPDLNIKIGRTAFLTNGDLDQSTKNRDTAYLEYVLGKQGLSLFVLTRNSDGPELQVYSISTNPEDLVQRVNEFHDRLAHKHPNYISEARALYSMLIEPASKQIKDFATVCIVPDGVLWNLPFQALMSSSNRYFIEDHALYYAPSLSILREMNRKRSLKEKTPSLIAFGNPVIGKDERNTDLCPLPEAEQEVAWIAKAFASENSKIFIGRDASEKTFKSLAPTYSIVHLATHGMIDNRQPLYSYLVLTKTEGDPDNDGRLEARQIMDMNLHADLAVLSACETANGKIAPGEGVIGMSWAFFVAGTRSMVVSEWEVNSAGASQLMRGFYSRFSRGVSSESTARALRSATVELMKDDRFRHPFYWASFVLVGGN